MALARRIATIEMLSLTKLPDGMQIAEEVLQIEGFLDEPIDQYLEALKELQAVDMIIWPAPNGPGVWIAITFPDNKIARRAWAEIHESEYYGCQLEASLVTYPERHVQAVISQICLPLRAFKIRRSPITKYKLPTEVTDLSSNSD